MNNNEQAISDLSFIEHCICSHINKLGNKINYYKIKRGKSNRLILFNYIHFSNERKKL